MKKLRITIGKKTYDVTVEVLSDDSPQPARPTAIRPAVAVALPASSSSGASAPPPHSPGAPGAILSPMAGLVKSMLVQAGDAVKAGQPLVILDAMKMENKITAPQAGAVASIEVKEGQSVQEGQVLLTLE
jgi:glutaconyl-CoA/methylmalonyl-CoA decarboxylase subunit gamma